MILNIRAKGQMEEDGGQDPEKSSKFMHVHWFVSCSACITVPPLPHTPWDISCFPLIFVLYLDFILVKVKKAKTILAQELGAREENENERPS